MSASEPAVYGPRQATALHGFKILRQCSPVQAWGAASEWGDVCLNVWHEQTKVVDGVLYVNVSDRGDEVAARDLVGGQGARARLLHVEHIANGSVRGYALIGKRGPVRASGATPWRCARENVRDLYWIRTISAPDADGVRWASLHTGPHGGVK
jgi:hypothetical protein